MKFLILFLFKIFILINCSPNKLTSKNKNYEDIYSNPIALNARSSYSTDSKINVVIPYNSKLKAEKTYFTNIGKGELHEWYFVPKINSYISGKYISLIPNKSKKEYKINLRWGDEDCPNQEEYYIFYSNIVIGYKEYGCHGTNTNLKKNGKFEIFENGIQISWDEHKENVTEFVVSEGENSPKEYSRKVNKYTEKIYYINKFNGWIKDKYYKIYINKNCYRYKDNCSIDCSESCVIHKSKNCKNMEYWERHENIFPLYCTKEN